MFLRRSSKNRVCNLSRRVYNISTMHATDRRFFVEITKNKNLYEYNKPSLKQVSGYACAGIHVRLSAFIYRCFLNAGKDSEESYGFELIIRFHFPFHEVFDGYLSSGWTVIRLDHARSLVFSVFLLAI